MGGCEERETRAAGKEGARRSRTHRRGLLEAAGEPAGDGGRRRGRRSVCAHGPAGRPALRARRNLLSAWVLHASGLGGKREWTLRPPPVSPAQDDPPPGGGARGAPGAVGAGELRGLWA